MDFIITEKDSVAERIAHILSTGEPVTENTSGVNIYKWDDTQCIGLAGHIVGVDFPEEYNNWHQVDPSELVHADVVTKPTKEDIVKTLKNRAKQADRIIIATDYDREGELIGKETLDLIRSVNQNAPVERVRFSSVTESEVTEAFANPDTLDEDLAEAGEARQIIDLLWGAALTRFLSLSSGQTGEDFISVGRVQSPTLKLIVDKEREIEEFEPEEYWEIFATVSNDESFSSQYFYLDDDNNEAERIWEEETASSVYDTLNQTNVGTVSNVSKYKRQDSPPIPFNTTEYIRAAGAIGYSANKAMDIAEDLYTEGYITYPRTDNTVYPQDIDLQELLTAFIEQSPFTDAAKQVQSESLSPTKGDQQTTDHPPIHPTLDIAHKSDLTNQEWEIYTLIARRFFATLADSALWQHLKVIITANDNKLKANGKRLLQPGYHEVYPYFATDENYVPPVEEGETITIDDVTIEQKETQPPQRYGQSKLIEEMESRGLGTKATRHNTIDKLYERGYIEGNPPKPTQLAKAVVEAAEEYADLIVDEEMTSQLEADMTAIAEGEKDLDEVTTESREILEDIFESLDESKQEIGDHLRASLKADKTIGPCPDCGSDLLLRNSQQGSYFVGCDGYPDCTYTLPLPNTGKPIVLDTICETHDLHEVKMLAGQNTFVHGCPRCQAEKAEETDDRIIGDCPACDSGELAIKRLESGSRLVGCTTYPECDYTLPLPRRGEIEIRDSYCDEHDLPELAVHTNNDDPWELGCPICNYQEYKGQTTDSDIKSIKGIGPKTAEKLDSVGISTKSELQNADPQEVAEEISGISADRLEDWQAKAN